MTKHRNGVAIIAGLVLVAAAAVGCSHTDRKAVSSEATTAVTTTQASATTTTAAPTPTGQPVGTATLNVTGGSTPVTVTYSINGGPEQTERNVDLPWEKQYPVYDKVETSVTADGGNEELTCTITMDGKLASFKAEARPTCSFAYYG